MNLPAIDDSEETLRRLEQERIAVVAIEPSRVLDCQALLAAADDALRAERACGVSKDTMFPRMLPDAPWTARYVYERCSTTGVGTANPWPLELEPFAASVAPWLDDVVDRLLRACVARFSFEKDVADALLKRHVRALTAVHYPEVEGRSGQLRFPDHVDWGVMTLYPAIGDRGLEVFTGGRWIEIEPRQDRMILYAGEVLARLSAGVIKPVVHRVRQSYTGGRTALIYYINADCGLKLPDGTTVGAHIARRLKRLHGE
jgi:isopenicillin N synthase-like dioxygenase